MWQELGIAPSRDPRAIKQAYAKRLKQVHPEDDPEGFQRLRAAYEWALRQAQALQAHAESSERDAAGVGAAAKEQAEPQPVISKIREPVPPQSAAAPQAPPPAAQPQSASPPPFGSRIIELFGTTAAPDFLPAPPPPRQAAGSLFELLLKTPQQERGAVLVRALRGRGWENLDFQAALQRAVIAGLSVDFERLFPLIEIFSAYYAWQLRPGRIGQDDPAITTLLARHAARQRRKAMEAPQIVPDRRRQRALRMLFNAPDERSFRRFRRGAANMRTMRAVIGQLRGHDTTVMRYEVNADSLQWWLQNLDANPRSWAKWAELLFFGTIGGPLVGLVLIGLVQVCIGYDATKHPAVFLPLLLISAMTPAGAALATDIWRLRGLGARAAALRQRWRYEPRRRRAAIGVTILVALATFGAGNIPGFEIFIVLAGLLLWFWNSLRLAIASVTLLAWPLQLPLSALLGFVSEHSPRALQHLNRGALLIGFPHWVAMFLAPPFIRLCNACHLRFTGRRPKEPLKLAFYSMLQLCLAGALLWVILSVALGSKQDPSPTAPTPLHRVSGPSQVPGAPPT